MSLLFPIDRNLEFIQKRITPTVSTFFYICYQKVETFGALIEEIWDFDLCRAIHNIEKIEKYLIIGSSGSGGGMCTKTCLWMTGFEVVDGGPYSSWSPFGWSMA